nr:hypothetical protein [Tanacetum cinerariifolium]
MANGAWACLGATLDGVCEMVKDCLLGRAGKPSSALKMYGAIKQGYSSGEMLSRTSSMSSDSCSSSSSVATSILDPGDYPKKVKMKLKQWAKLVRYSILETSSNNKNVAE